MTPKVEQATQESSTLREFTIYLSGMANLVHSIISFALYSSWPCLIIKFSPCIPTLWCCVAARSAFFYCKCPRTHLHCQQLPGVWYCAKADWVIVRALSGVILSTSSSFELEDVLRALYISYVPTSDSPTGCAILLKRVELANISTHRVHKSSEIQNLQRPDLGGNNWYFHNFDILCV